MEEFQLPKRRGLAVYIRGRRVLRVLRHYGRLQYVSRRAHYAILYVNEEEVPAVTERLLKLHNVTGVTQSIWPDLDPAVTTLVAAGVNKEQDGDDQP